MKLFSLTHSIAKLDENKNAQQLKDVVVNECGDYPKQDKNSPVNPEYYSKLYGVNKKTNSDSSTSDVLFSLFEALDSISNPDSDFCNMDIKHSNFKFNLKHPRDKFIEDVNSNISNLSASEKKQIFNYFSFELHNGDSLSMTGFPKIPSSIEKDKILLNPKLSEIVKNIEPLVEKFTSDNEIISDGEVVTAKVAKDLNSILKAFPDLFSIIGNRQHYSHDFTLDVHIFSVLQECIKNPEFEQLSESDKKTIMMSAILHDIEKTENMPDSSHPSNSAKKAMSMIDKFECSSFKKDAIYKLIKNHNLLEKCNIASKGANQKKLISFYAKELKEDNLLEMEQILTKSDLLCVKENNKSYYKYKEAYENVFSMLFEEREKNI